MHFGRDLLAAAAVAADNAWRKAARRGNEISTRMESSSLLFFLPQETKFPDKHSHFNDFEMAHGVGLALDTTILLPLGRTDWKLTFSRTQNLLETLKFAVRRGK